MFYQRELTVNELRTRAPSIFAEDAKSTVSNKYLLIPTAKIVDAMIKADFIPVAAKQTNGKDLNHGKHVIHFSHKSLADKLTGKQEIPLIRVQNSHDAKSSFQLDTGFFRLVCSNGLVMPGQMFNSARIIHKIGMEDDVIAASYRILDSFQAQTEQVDTMKMIELSQDEKQLFAEGAARLVFDAEQIQANKDNRHRVRKEWSLESSLLRPRRTEDNKNDIWTVFNRVQENVIKGGNRVFSETGQFKAMREVNSIDREKQINIELMTLAMKMSEIKLALVA